ncbi:hypothetical protein ASE95_13775 [Sphingomonas sp. Leaf231]|uniref:hypothetical protein n=1 Tax=Sphingomonas sp. Leaf231 TaxID=1736301 RepID=UPI0006F2C714|nr:hypothetical protein [Sphingomonas sp. Leaf231]KQN90533.1 hypothetical protein ASE95_13775 [Sphingomonas sp. Leaf231]
MSITDNLADIANEIETLSADLLRVNAMVDVLGKPAMDKANEIDKALQSAKDRFATALADQADREREERLSRFSDISVSIPVAGQNLMNTGFIIRYKAKTWDMVLKDSVPKQHECNGFSVLPDDVYDYLVSKKPEAIPGIIMELAPGKPHEAMSIYLQSKARGFVKSNWGALAA